jgi:hypothetical protein
MCARIIAGRNNDMILTRDINSNNKHKLKGRVGKYLKAKHIIRLNLCAKSIEARFSNRP